MKIAICDDDIIFAQELKALIQQFFIEKACACEIVAFSCVEDFVKSELTAYDLIFLDVLIHNSNGMEAARIMRLYNKTALLIFASHFVEFSPKGYEVNAFRYLLKRDLKQTLKTCLTDAYEKLQARLQSITLNTTDNSRVLIYLHEILYIESSNHHIFIQLSDKRHKAYASLSSIEKTIDCLDFIRVQRSFIVNLRKVDSFKGFRLAMENGKEIICSRDCKKQIMELYLEIQGE